VFLFLEFLSSTAVGVVVGLDLCDVEIVLEVFVLVEPGLELFPGVVYELDGPRTEVGDPVCGSDLVVDVPVVCVLGPPDDGESVCECDDPD
jgi:hypothetical protein